MRIALIAIATAYAAGFVYHGPSQTWLIPLVGIPWLLVAFWLIPATINRDQLRRPNATIDGSTALQCLFLAWLIWLAAGIIWSDWPIVSYWYFLSVAWYPVAFLALGTVPDSTTRLRDWLLVIGAAGVSYALIEWMITGGRASGLFLDPNSFGGLINLLLFTALGEIWLSSDDNKRRRLLLAGLLVILATTLVLTRSRGAWIAFAGGAVLTALVLIRYGRQLTRKPLWFGLASVGLGLFSGTLLLGLGALAHRVGSLAGAASNPRWLIWQSTLKMIGEHGWLGTGLGTFVIHYPQFRSPLEAGSTGYMAHNDYLQFALETGLPGLLLFVAITMLIFWLFVRYCLRAPDYSADGHAVPLRVGALLGLIAVLTAHAHALVNFIFYETTITVAAGTVLALALMRLSLYGQNTTKMTAIPRFHPIAILLFGILSVGLLADAGMGYLFNGNEHNQRTVSGPRYQVALMTNTFYPVNTTSASYLLTAQYRLANASTRPRVKAMAEDMAVKTAKSLLTYKARDCLAQTVLVSYPTRPLQRKGVQHAPEFKQAKAALQTTIRQFPLCIPPYLAYADLLRHQGHQDKALDVLLSAIKWFRTRIYSEARRLQLLEHAGRLAVQLGRAKLATNLALSLRANEADNQWAQNYLAQHTGGKSK